MASSIQFLRSVISQERPFPSNLLEGQPAVNLNTSEPGLFFKVTDGSIVKFGPVAITDNGAPPNSSPAGLGGNCVGELWFDASVSPGVLKLYDGQKWVTLATPSLQQVTSNGNTTVDTITVGALVASSISYPTADGSAGQIISTDGAGNLTFIDRDTDNGIY